jgi:histidine kinase/DNA gyrase B/HSP90-like ATPase
MTPKDSQPDDELVKQIDRCISSGQSYDAPLVTDQRVLARITEGIYRQPASALRELIANAYDADATVVSISTNAPRFDEMKVSDDGIGMSPRALANLVQHIGGSAKRTQRGPTLGLTSLQDPTRSGRGRRLIGRIGIGLFSVAQLTRQFVIITKSAGTEYQLLAHVTLNFPDEAAELAKVDATGEHSFQAGQARIWAEKTPDTDGHGTTILLTTLLPRVVHLLQSRDIWDALAEEAEIKGGRKRKPPLYHIGRIDPENPEVLLQKPCFPWLDDVDERDRFEGLVDRVAEAWQQGDAYARLEHAVDNYFQMIWTLGLSLPLEYVSKHPFNLTGKEVKNLFKLPARRGATSLEALHIGTTENVSSKANLSNPEDSTENFNVTIDGVRLARPIRFYGYPKTAQAHQSPVMFVGYAEPDLSKIPESQRAGRLAFAGYFFWVPRVIPQEHNGLLVRVNGASGTLFDSTFLKYQVGERRLKQLIAEVYVEAGLESALNIDRESFNTAHPHYQILASWVHNSLRLIRNTLKDLQTEARKKKTEHSRRAGEAELTNAVNQLIFDLTDYEPSDVPEVVFVKDEAALEEAILEGKIAYLRDQINGSLGIDHNLPAPQMELLASSVARLLEAHGVLQDLDRTSQAALIAGILTIFTLARHS